MADFNAIKTEIDSNITTNGRGEITGATLNQTLKDMLDAVDETKLDHVSDVLPGNNDFPKINEDGTLADSGFNFNSFPKKFTVEDITALTTEDFNKLDIGDILLDFSTKKSYNLVLRTMIPRVAHFVCVDLDSVTTVVYLNNEYDQTVVKTL